MNMLIIYWPLETLFEEKLLPKRNPLPEVAKVKRVTGSLRHRRVRGRCVLLLAGHGLRSNSSHQGEVFFILQLRLFSFWPFLLAKVANLGRIDGC